MGVELFRYVLIWWILLCTRASAEIIYGYVGQPVHLPCSILEATGIALTPSVESMWAHYNSSVYSLVIVRDKEGTKEQFRQPILGRHTISGLNTVKNQQFYGRVNVSASRGLIIYSVQTSDAGNFLCRYKDTETKVSGKWEMELIVFNVTSPTPAPNAKSSTPSGDNLNTEGSCIIYMVMLGVILGGLLGAVLLFFNRNKLQGWINLCRPNTSENDGDSYELPTAQNNKGHDSQSGDPFIGTSQAEIEGTDSLDWDGEVTPRTPHTPHTTQEL